MNYRATINDNMLVTVMIETLEGVAMANEIAATHGVDVIILGNNDLSSFSGWSQNDPRYQDAIIKVHDAALKYGKYYGNAGEQYLTGYTVSADTRMVQNGPACDGWRPAGARPRPRHRAGRRAGDRPAGRRAGRGAGAPRRQPGMRGAPVGPSWPSDASSEPGLTRDSKTLEPVPRVRFARRPSDGAVSDDHYRQVSSAPDVSEGRGRRRGAAVPRFDGARRSPRPPRRRSAWPSCTCPTAST